MKRFLKRSYLDLADRIRYNPVIRGALAHWKLLRDRLARPKDHRCRARAIERLCAAARLTGNDATLARIERRIDAHARNLDVAALKWDEFLPSIRKPRISKAAIIKPWVSDREKGVVFISFEDQWARLLEHCDLRKFARRYTLVVSPTWCPPHSLVNILFPRAYPEPFFSLISNRKDLEILPRLSPKYQMIPLYASSWVNPGYYPVIARDRRDLDIVVIANFGKYKRHHALFKALRKMPGVRATLIGQSQGQRTEHTIRREAWAYGVEERVTVLSHVSNETLADHLSRARLSVILSRREGSCVAVVESLFADTPVVLLQGAAVGSAAFINEHTGCFVPEQQLASGLEDALRRHQEFAPRRWAEAHISCFQSSQTLKDVLRQSSLRQGLEWTTDIAPLCWRPDPQLVDSENAPWLRDEWAWARTNLGVEIGSLPADGSTTPVRPAHREAACVAPASCPA